MARKNKFYWMEGTTRNEIEVLMNHRGFRTFRSQKNRRILVVLQSLLLALIASASYYQEFKEWLGNTWVPLALQISVTVLVLTGFSLLRVSVRGIAEAPDELLDERQRAIRNSNYRYSYLILGYVVMAYLLVIVIAPGPLPFDDGINGDASFLYISLILTMASLPSMVMAWREKDI